MFTQRDEEKYILKFFKNKIGHFLDIGAANGECFSTTRTLALQGWSGVCVEPSPTVLPALRKLYEDNPAIQIIEKVITNKTGEIEFFDSGGDMISTVDIKHKKIWETKAGVVFTSMILPALSVGDLFVEVGYDFDFISLDVEGTNIEIFSKFPFDKLVKTKMFCVEFDLCSEEVLALVKPFGFRLLHQTAENLLLVRG